MRHTISLLTGVRKFRFHSSDFCDGLLTQEPAPRALIMVGVDNTFPPMIARGNLRSNIASDDLKCLPPVGHNRILEGTHVQGQGKNPGVLA